MSDNDYGEKVKRSVRKYSLEEFLSELVELYESNQASLRELEQLYNTRIVVERLTEQGILVQTGREETVTEERHSDQDNSKQVSYEIGTVTIPELTREEVIQLFISPDELSARERRGRETLIEQNITDEYEELKQEISRDTASYQTIRHYLNNYEETDTSLEGNLTPEDAIQRHSWAVATCEGILETLVLQLERNDLVDAEGVTVSADVRYETEDGVSMTLRELLDTASESVSGSDEL